MRRAVPGLVLVCAAALGGCSQGVLDPRGPVAAAERLLFLINSTAIMLVVVIPVVLAGINYWFPKAVRQA